MQLGRYVKIAIDQNRATAVVTERLKHRLCQVLPCGWAEVNTCESALHCENIRHIFQFFIQGNAGCGFLRLLHSEARVLVAEVLVHFAKDERKYAALAWILLVITPVHEDVLLTRVAVKIAVKDQASLLVDLLDEPLGMPDRGMQSLVRRLPSAIQVAAG